MINQTKPEAPYCPIPHQTGNDETVTHANRYGQWKSESETLIYEESL